MVTMTACLPLVVAEAPCGVIRPGADFQTIGLEGSLSEKARTCPWPPPRACAYLPSLLGYCLCAGTKPRETLFELAEHVLQLGELACAKASRDLRIDRLRGRRDRGHQLHALFRDRDHAAALISLGGLALDQVARLQIAQDARQARPEQERGAREFRYLDGLDGGERAEDAPLLLGQTVLAQ